MSKDYGRFTGRLAKIVVRAAVDNQKAFEGRLRGRRRRPRAARIVRRDAYTGCRWRSLRAADCEVEF
jgi:ribosome maturation factor RimP